MNIFGKRNSILLVFIVVFSLAFSSWLMFHTFSYDAKSSSMLIAVKAWSDFGAHTPLIRSFSLGDNWPPEYPLFPGEPIRYHFLFYFLVGMLEKAGARIDWALNIPSIIGFAGLMIGICVIAQQLFRDKRITLLSLLFFLANGSLSFIRFFKLHPLSPYTIADIVDNTAFPSFAPWGDGPITAFWNLNIYTNQRHLALAFALGLIFIGILLTIEKKTFRKQLPFTLPEIAILAILPYFHQPTLLICGIFTACYFLLFPRLRRILLLIGVISALIVVPQILPFLHGPKTVQWHPGYLSQFPISISQFPTFLYYWFQNLGLHFFLIPLGWLIAPARIKKITIPLFFLFLIPNLFQFSVEMAANHKFFNFYLILGNMLSVYALIRFFSIKFINFIKVIILIIVIGSMTLSGLIDFFPIANDHSMAVPDIPVNEAATWIRDNTPPDALFLNSSYFFHPASLAGRKIFQGWPYFAWSAGYKTHDRDAIMKELFESTDQKRVCQLLSENHLSYSVIDSPWPLEEIRLINPLLTSQQPVFTNTEKTVSIYQTSTLCRPTD